LDKCEELEAEIERLRGLYDSVTDQAVRYADDNARLRAALQAMLDGEPNAAQLAVRALEPKP
jgi:hypothetical protein